MLALAAWQGRIGAGPLRRRLDVLPGGELHPLVLLFALSRDADDQQDAAHPEALTAGRRAGLRYQGCSFQAPFSILTITWLRESTPLWSVGLML